MTHLAAQRFSKCRTALVVDDEFLIAELIASELEAEGWRVVRASNGREGLRAFGAEKPDLVITDLHMPEMGGEELATRIQASERGVPIILVSGEHTGVRADKTAAFAAALDKPVNLFRLKREAVRLLEDAHAPVEAARCH